jgi:Undecaprenyl-phosphate glucose phosphotransferase
MQSRHAADLARAAGANPPAFRGPHVPVLGLDTLAQPAGGRVATIAPGRNAEPIELRSVASLETRRAHPRIHPSALASAVRFTDFLIVLATGAATLATQSAFHWPLATLPAATAVLVLGSMARSVGPGARYQTDLIRRRLPRQVTEGAVHVLSAFAFGLVVMLAVLQPNISERAPLIQWLLLWALAAVAGIAVARVAVSLLVARWRAAGRFRQTVAILGTGGLAERLVQRLRAASPDSVDIVGVFDDRAARRGVGAELRDLIHGTTPELIDLSRRFEIDRIIVALPHSAEHRLLEILRKLHTMPVEISLAPDMVGFNLPGKDQGEFGGLPLLDVYGRPMSFGESLVKNAFDKVAATVLTVLLSPVLLLTALAIKLDSKGPALFRQNRYGFGDRVIQVFKFRTMRADAADHNGERQTLPNDPRVTRIGWWLRRWSLDELPQLLNVLRGELSLVGPRPHAVSMRVRQRRNEDIVPDYALRHHVKPGITGWAQVMGYHGPVETERALLQRVAYDLDYINNWSLWFDIRILFRTLKIVFGRRRSY